MAQWKPIKGWENLYEVSDDGRVRNILTGLIKKNTKMRAYGYLIVTLKGLDATGTHKKATLRVHRLVAEAFIPNPENKPCVDHINTNKEDNTVGNLRWVTYTENMRNPITYAQVVKNRREECKREGWHEKQIETHAHQAKKVICIESGIVYPSAREAERVLGLPRHRVHKSCSSAKYHNKYQFAGRGGKPILHFKYVED